MARAGKHLCRNVFPSMPALPGQVDVLSTCPVPVAGMTRWPEAELETVALLASNSAESFPRSLAGEEICMMTAMEY